jgi:hypothetical protein
MSDLINNIFVAPLKSPVILFLSLAYTVIEAIRIYDVRLIQAKTRGFYSGVAIEAEGRLLPRWVGYIHFAGWLVFIALLILNWRFAITLYAILFILRVLPVLERIGGIMMRPFLHASRTEREKRSNNHGDN